jgi:cytochrome c biogenesis protein CcdA
MCFKRRFFKFIPFFLLIGFIFPGRLSAEETVAKPTVIFFHSLHCAKCVKLKAEFMPKLEEQFKGGFIIDYRDIGNIENYKFLLGLREQYGYRGNNDLPVVFLDGRFLSGKKQVEDNLARLIREALSGKQKMTGGSIISADLMRNFLSFRPMAVAAAGLIDGINPCAFTVIVFFISFLALQGYRKRELAVIGLSFISAVFITYLFIGLGFFNFLYRLNEFWVLARIVNLSIGLFSISLGVIAVYDFCKFKKTKDTSGLILQLPEAVKDQIRRIIGLHYRRDKNKKEEKKSKSHALRLIGSALITGFLVSILEAICTGQTYLPTISFILKSGQLRLYALGYLLLYNFLFIIPLLLIFIFALSGVTSAQFSAILKRNMPLVKILMAILFFGLGILIIQGL